MVIAFLNPPTFTPRGWGGIIESLRRETGEKPYVFDGGTSYAVEGYAEWVDRARRLLNEGPPVDVLVTAGVGVSAALRAQPIDRLVAVNPQPESSASAEFSGGEGDGSSLEAEKEMTAALKPLTDLSVAASTGEISQEDAERRWVDLATEQLQAIPEPARAVAIAEIRSASSSVVRQFFEEPMASVRPPPDPPWERLLPDFRGSFTWVHAAPTQRFAGYEQLVTLRATRGSWRYVACQTEWAWLENPSAILSIIADNSGTERRQQA